MKRFLIQIWLTTLCFLLLGDVHAWEVPNYIRINSGSRMWFTSLQGDLIRPNHLKLDLIDNLGVSKDKLSWEFFGSMRFANIHVARLRFEPLVTYESGNGSFLQTRHFRAGYDLDLYMSPQMLFGANVDLTVFNYDTRIRDIQVGGTTYDYFESQTRTIPMIGLHGTYYPILDDVALRPNFSSRVNWWNYESLEAWDWEIAAAVDIPINRLWTWNVNGGYRLVHLKSKREKDTLDVNRTGFFVETSLLF